MHHRKSIRLHYDYSHPGSYFITICSHEKTKLFCSSDNGTVHLTDIGKIIMKCWIEIPDHFPSVSLDHWVIMPNHIHGILVIKDNNGCSDTACRVPPPTCDPQTQTSEQYGLPTKQSIPTIVRSFKSAVSKEVHKNVCQEGKIWQGRFWERVIRDEKELDAYREYIINNPMKWELDSLNERSCG